MSTKAEKKRQEELEQWRQMLARKDPHWMAATKQLPIEDYLSGEEWTVKATQLPRCLDMFGFMRSLKKLAETHEPRMEILMWGRPVVGVTSATQSVTFRAVRWDRPCDHCGFAIHGEEA